MIKKPSTRISDIFAVFFIALAFLIFLVILHILAINSTGDTQDVINTLFIIMLWVYIFLIVVGFTGLVIHSLRYLFWMISTPKWLKEKGKKEMQYARQ